MIDALSKEHRRGLLVCVAILGVGVLGLLLMSALKPRAELVPESARIPLVDAHPLVWRTGPFEVSASGRVQPTARVQLQAQVSGDVISVSNKLTSGASFSKGDELVLINPTTFKAQVAELEAQLTSAKADLKLSITQLTRSRQLLELKAASREEVDQRSASVDSARAQVAQIEASLNSAKINLQRTKIIAPFDGRVVTEQVSVGDVLAPGAPFAEIYATDTFEMAVALSEANAVLLGDLFDEQRARIPARIEAEFGGSLFAWQAYVDRIEPGLDDLTRTIDVIVRVDKPEQRGTAVTATNVAAPPLLPGMFARAFIPTRDIGRHAEIFRDSLRPDGSIWYVATDSNNVGEIAVDKVTVLTNQRDAVYIQSGIENDGPLYLLGSDTGNVLPGNRIQVRYGSAEINASQTPDEAAPTIPPVYSDPIAAHQESNKEPPEEEAREQTTPQGAAK